MEPIKQQDAWLAKELELQFVAGSSGIRLGFLVLFIKDIEILSVCKLIYWQSTGPFPIQLERFE